MRSRTCLLLLLRLATTAAAAPRPSRHAVERPVPYLGLGHTEPVTALAWSPDGKTLATGSADETILLWGTATRKPRATLTGYSAAIVSLAWSPDGKTLAGADNGATAMLWDAVTGRRRAVLTPLAGSEEVLFGDEPPPPSQLSLVSHSQTSPIRSLTWSPDGKLLAGAEYPNVLLWDGATGQRRAARKIGDVDLLRWSPDGRTLAMGGGPRGIAVSFWDMSGETHHRGLAYDDAFLRTMAWSPDGKEIAATDDGRAVLIWGVASGRRRTLMPRHEGSPYGSNPLAWSPDGRRLATGRNDRGDVILLWNVVTGRPEAELADPDIGRNDLYGVALLLWSPNGWILAAQEADRARLTLWDPIARVRRAVLTPAFGPVAWSGDGRSLATGGLACTASVWNVLTGTRAGILATHVAPLGHVAWRPDGRAVAGGTGELDQLPSSADASQAFVTVWDAVDGNRLTRLKGLSDGTPRNPLSGLPDRLYGLSWSPDGSSIATTAGQYGAEWGVDVLVGQPPRIWYRSNAMLWDAGTGRRRATLHGATAVVAWSPDGKTLATGGGRSVLIWDTASGQRRASLPVCTEVWQLAWGPDGKSLAMPGFTSSGFVYLLWDAATRKQRATLSVSKGAYSLLAWSPRAPLFATTLDDRLMDLWDTNTGAHLRTLTLRAAAPPQANDWITARSASLAWSPDGTLLATGLPRDGTLKIWRAARGQLAAILTGPAPGAAPLAWSPDGRILATGSADGSLRLWDGATGHGRVALYALDGGSEWLAITPEGYFAASAHGADGLQWRQGTKLWPLASFRRRLERPDLIRRALAR